MKGGCAMNMRPLQTDLSVFSKLDFERPPVGVKYLFFRPKGIEQLSMDKNLAFCEMLTEAQRAKAPFYFSKDNNETCVGKILLGMTEMEPFAEAGQIGPRLGMVQEARVNHNFYQINIRARRFNHHCYPETGRNRDESNDLFNGRAIYLKGHHFYGMLMDLCLSLRDR
jgi:hypothetical protein